jgi:hypothetical protein
MYVCTYVCTYVCALITRVYAYMHACCCIFTHVDSDEQNSKKIPQKHAITCNKKMPTCHCLSTLHTYIIYNSHKPTYTHHVKQSQIYIDTSYTTVTNLHTHIIYNSHKPTYTHHVKQSKIYIHTSYTTVTNLHTHII